MAHENGTVGRARRARRRRTEATLVALAGLATVIVLVVAYAANRPTDGDPAAGTPGGTTVTVSTTVPTNSPTATSAPSTTTTNPTTTTTTRVVPVPPPAPKPTTTVPRTSSPALPPGLLGVDIERLPTGSKIVALTFDAGANADGLTSILATLREQGVPATFFLTGDFATNFPAQSARIAAAGHRIANHSRSHPHFPALSDAAIRAELVDAERAIRASSGRDPRPLFRFPFGDRNARTIAVVNAAGYLPVRWTVDSLGWKGTSGGMTADTVTARVLGALRPGEIVLMHVGSNPDDHTTLDANALPAVIAQIRAAGYRFVTLDALLS